MAEQIERNGAKFYRKAADNTDLTSAKGLLLKLATMEDDHERTFGKLRNRFLSNEWKFDSGQPDSEVELYLRAIADGYVFNLKEDPADRLTGKESLADILRFAIKAEEDSIIFYLGLRDAVTAENGGNHIETIIKEERGHIVLLSRELAKL